MLAMALVTFAGSATAFGVDEEDNLPSGPFVQANNLEIDFIVDDFVKRTNNKRGSLPSIRHPCS